MYKFDRQHFATVANLPAGPLSRDERNLYWDIGRNLYRGTGHFLELGGFLGASTHAFCCGLAENQHKNEVRITSYDLFYFDGSWGNPSVYGIEPNQDFEPIFRDNLRDFQGMIDIEKGDILLKTPPVDKHTEILFVDLAKTENIFRHVVEVFYPQVVPGGFIVHQDYLAQRMQYIKAFTEYFHGYFDIVYPDAGCTVLFRLAKPWNVPAQEISAFFDLPAGQMAALVLRNSQRYPGQHKAAFDFSRGIYLRSS